MTVVAVLAAGHTGFTGRSSVIWMIDDMKPAGRESSTLTGRKGIVATLTSAVLAACLGLTGCGGGSSHAVHRTETARRGSSSATSTGSSAHASGHAATTRRGLLAGMPSYPDPANIYAADRAGDLSSAVRHDPQRVYVPNSLSNTVTEIDPRTLKVIRTFSVGALPQHVVPSYDLKTLWVTNDDGNSLTPISPRTGLPGRPIPVTDPYNMYFTPDGRYAIVVEERMHILAFRDAHTMALHKDVPVPCSGVDHMDFSADGRFLLASCEFSGQVVRVSVPREQVTGVLKLTGDAAMSSMPQDVKLSPDGKTFYVADMRGGVWEIGANDFKVHRFVRTGYDAHGLYASRNGRDLYVTNRRGSSISVISFATGNVIAKWPLPHATPDMGGVSADGRTLWLSGRYTNEAYAIDTRTGRLRARIAVGAGPHGLAIFPQPGRYSLGHTGVFR